MNSSPVTLPNMIALSFYRDIALILGNGSLKIGMTLLYAIAERLEHARTKHPTFAEGPAHALGIIGSEYQELCHAVEKETKQRQRDEALDVLVTALRFVAGEHL